MGQRFAGVLVGGLLILGAFSLPEASAQQQWGDLRQGLDDEDITIRDQALEDCISLAVSDTSFQNFIEEELDRMDRRASLGIRGGIANSPEVRERLRRCVNIAKHAAPWWRLKQVLPDFIWRLVLEATQERLETRRAEINAILNPPPPTPGGTIAIPTPEAAQQLRQELQQIEDTLRGIGVADEVP